MLGFLEPVVARVPLGSARDRLRELLEEKWSAGAGPEASARRVTRRIDLMGVDEVPEGTMKMAFVDGTDQVLVVHTWRDPGVQGICTHEYFELDKGFHRRRLAAAPTASRPARSPVPSTCRASTSPTARPSTARGDPLAFYPVVIEDGRVLIEVPEGPLPVNE